MASIQNNMMANNIHRMYTKNSNAMNRSAQRLSSGFRINGAGDDAAGLAISEKMRAQIRGLNMAIKNCTDAISLIQTAEGALQEVHAMLQRMNELAVQAASDTNADIDRNALQLEFENLQEEINQIASTTKFNDTVLLDGSLGISGTSTGGGGVGFNTSKTGYTFDEVMNTDKYVHFIGPLNSKVIMETHNTGASTTTVSASFDVDGNLLLRMEGGTGIATVFTQEMFDRALSAATGGPANAHEYKIEVNSSGIMDFTQFFNSSVNTTSVTMSAPAQGFSTNSNGVTFKNNLYGRMYNNIVIYNDVGTVGATAGYELGRYMTKIQLNSMDSYTADEINQMLKNANSMILADFTGQKTGAEIMNGFEFARNMHIGRIPTGGSGQFPGGTVGTAPSGLDVGSTATGDRFIIQVGAEEGQILGIHIKAMNTDGLGISKNHVNISTREDAESAISACRDAVKKVATQRAELGALQNRLEHRVDVLDNIAQNLQAAESLIRDADMAKEMMEYTKNSILTQMSTALLAQANLMSKNVLQLLTS